MRIRNKHNFPKPYNKEAPPPAPLLPSFMASKASKITKNPKKSSPNLYTTPSYTTPHAGTHPLMTVRNARPFARLSSS